MSWILSSVEQQFVLKLHPYKTSKGTWDYLKKIYNQETAARKFQLELELSEYSQGNKTIEEYHSGFITLWSEYTLN